MRFLNFILARLCFSRLGFPYAHSFISVCLVAIMLFRVPLLLFFQLLPLAASTDSNDFVVLKSLKDSWENVPPNWAGDDPCGNNWVGISCSNNRISSITLSSLGLKGGLASDITGLSELQILDLSFNKDITGPLPQQIGELKNLTTLIVAGCGFSGRIPPSIGSLTKLVYLALYMNNFIGPIPPTFGYLSNLRWLDIAENKLEGSIPISTRCSPGLDMLVNTKHFHFGKNRLYGEIPSQLFSSSMKLIHLLLENNQLTGSIPSSLGLVHTLEVLRLDGNFLSGYVPENLNNLTQVQELYLSNNRITGPFPNLTGMDLVHSVYVKSNSKKQSIFTLKCICNTDWVQIRYSVKQICCCSMIMQGSQQ